MSHVTKKKIDSINPILTFSAIIIIVITGYYIFNTYLKNNYNDIKYVNDQLECIFSDNEYSTYDIEKKKEVCLDTLNKLENEKRITDIKYIEESALYEFKYGDGTSGGLMVEELDFEYEGATKKYTAIDPNKTIKQVNNKVEYDTSSYPFEEKDLKAKVMYGLGYEDIYKKIKERTDIWNGEYLNTTIDDDCTVNDFMTGLDGYNLIIFSLHGTLFEGVPAICTEEKVTEKNMKEYKSDLKKDNIAIVTYEKDGKTNTCYLIKPSFFEEHYRKNELDNTIIYVGCCKGYKNEKLVESLKKSGAKCVIGNSETVYSEYNIYMQDAFVYGLLCGDTASEALKYAKSFYGQNDGEWLKKYYQSITDKENAEPLIYCGESFRLVTDNKNTVSIPEEKMSYDQALKTGNLLYKTAHDIYWMYSAEFGDDIFYVPYVTSEYETQIGYINITNIDEIRSRFTEKGFKQFLKFNEIKQENGKYYGLYGNRGSDLFYEGNELNINVEDITSNKLTFTSIEKYSDPDRPSEVRNKFTLIRENGDWKIDEFTLPD